MKPCLVIDLPQEWVLQLPKSLERYEPLDFAAVARSDGNYHVAAFDGETRPLIAVTDDQHVWWWHSAFESRLPQHLLEASAVYDSDRVLRSPIIVIGDHLPASVVARHERNGCIEAGVAPSDLVEVVRRVALMQEEAKPE